MVALILAACAPSGEGLDSGAPPTAELGEWEAVVPGSGLPPEVEPQASNNNLDVTWHEGEAFLAFRTAPSHFASDQTVLYVMRSADERRWTHELTVHLGTDLREPRLLSWQGRLFFYFAVLGTSPLDFEPQGTMLAVREADGSWSEPAWWRQDGFIPWRIRVVDGVPEMIGYTGGAEIYDLGDGEYPALQVSWLQSADGEQWEARVPGQEVVHTGGASETDLARTAEGAVIAVARNEAGEPEGFGSLVCRGEPEAPADWSCVHDPRKFDSPLVLEEQGRIWLIARRNLTEDGAYDLSVADPSYDELTLSEQSLSYQAAYWGQPKRCSLWLVDPETLAVELVADLPSKGDTCFASTLRQADGSHAVYNYTNDPDGPELSWIEGQTGETMITRQTLVFR